MSVCKFCMGTGKQEYLVTEIVEDTVDRGEDPDSLPEHVTATRYKTLTCAECKGSGFSA